MENKLGAGVTEKDIRSAISASGYPLQTVVARELRQHAGVQEEWGFIDSEDGTTRAIDLLAECPLYELKGPSPRVRPTLDLLVECKTSDLPYVFFLADKTPFTPRFPLLAGLKSENIEVTTDDDPSIWNFAGLHALGLWEHSFLTSDPRFAMNFTRCERKGSKIVLSGNEPYNSLVRPLMKAAEHFRRLEAPPPTAMYFDAHLVIPLAVLDSPMVAVSVGEPDEVSMVPWVRVPRHHGTEETGWFHRHNVFAIDIVHSTFLGRYVSEHVLPFARCFGERALKHQVVLAEGRGFVSGWAKSRSWQVESRLQPRTVEARTSRAKMVGSRLPPRRRRRSRARR